MNPTLASMYELARGLLMFKTTVTIREQNTRLCIRHDGPIYGAAFMWDMNEPFPRGTCAVLTDEESRASCQSLTIEGLKRRLESLGAPKLDLKDDIIREWLELFIQEAHSFGTAYAWAVSTLHNTNHKSPGADPQLRSPSRFHSSLTMLRADALSKYTEQSEGQTYITYANQVQPRRIWDVCSNRVIPFSWINPNSHEGLFPAQVAALKTQDDKTPFLTRYFAVSHNWVHEAERQSVWTPINNFMWPVPIPQSVNLTHVRNQLLVKGIRYCWLDVMCLRQYSDGRHAGYTIRDQTEKELLISLRYSNLLDCLVKPSPGAPDTNQPTFPDYSQVIAPLMSRWDTHNQEWLQEIEAIRKAEWRLDVPTIGNIYSQAVLIVIYPNGLGLRFDHSQISLAKKPDADRYLTIPLGGSTDRHWLNRAWTLQEIALDLTRYTLGGPITLWDLRATKELVIIVTWLLGFLRAIYEKFEIRHVIAEMLRRKYTTKIDPVAGLMYMIGYGKENLKLPVYQEFDDPNDVWSRYMMHQESRFQGDRASTFVDLCILFRFPHPSGKGWFPSWDQISNHPDYSLTEPRKPLGNSNNGYELDMNNVHLRRGCKLELIEDDPNADDPVPTKQDTPKPEPGFTFEIKLGSRTDNPQIEEDHLDSWDTVRVHCPHSDFKEPPEEGEYAILAISMYVRDQIIAQLPKFIFMNTAQKLDKVLFSHLVLCEVLDRNHLGGNDEGSNQIHLRKVAAVQVLAPHHEKVQKGLGKIKKDVQVFIY